MDNKGLNVTELSDKELERVSGGVADDYYKGWKTCYTVKYGDVLSVIAQKYGVTVDTILKNNRDLLSENNNELYAGMVLRILR